MVLGRALSVVLANQLRHTEQAGRSEGAHVADTETVIARYEGVIGTWNGERREVVRSNHRIISPILPFKKIRAMPVAFTCAVSGKRGKGVADREGMIKCC